MRKPKFKPEITRVKLNPEQAVLSCTCWAGITMTGHYQWLGALGGACFTRGAMGGPIPICAGGTSMTGVTIGSGPTASS